MKILIIKPSSLGDIIHTLPVVQALKDHWPEAEIDWLVFDTFKEVVGLCPLISEILVFQRHRWNRLTCQGEVARFISSELRKKEYDLVIDLQGLLRSGLLTYATRAPRKIGLQDAREGARFFYNEIVHWSEPKLHAIDRYLKTMDHLGIAVSSVRFPMALAGRLNPLVERRLPETPFVLVNPFSRGEFKRWRLSGFQEVMGFAPDIPFVIIGQKGDAAEASLLAGRNIINLAGQTTMLDMVHLVARSSGLLTNDSGPMHLGVALGVPVVALFGQGASDPALTGPYGKNGSHTLIFDMSESHPLFDPSIQPESPELRADINRLIAGLMGNKKRS